MWSTSVPQDGKHDDATAQLAIGDVRICHYYMISVALVLAFYPLWTIGGPQGRGGGLESTYVGHFS